MNKANILKRDIYENIFLRQEFTFTVNYLRDTTWPTFANKISHEGIYSSDHGEQPSVAIRSFYRRRMSAVFP